MTGEDEVYVLAGRAAADHLSRRWGLPVEPDTNLDVRETPIGLVRLVLHLLDLQPGPEILVPVRPLLTSLQAFAGDEGPALLSRRVPTYRFRSIETLTQGGCDGG